MMEAAMQREKDSAGFSQSFFKASFEDGRVLAAEECGGQPLEGGKNKAMDFPLEPPERTQS